MADEKKSEEKSGPPVIDAETAAAGQLVLRTRMLIKMGISFEDPRLRQAVNQLGWWPQVLFEIQLDENEKYMSEVRINENDRVVEFDLTLLQVPETDELTKRAGALVGWCQQLLGDDWLINIMNRKRKGGKYKVIFKGDRLRALEARPPTLVDAPFPDAVTKFNRYRADGKSLGRDDDLSLGPILPPDTKR